MVNTLIKIKKATSQRVDVAFLFLEYYNNLLRRCHKRWTASSPILKYLTFGKEVMCMDVINSFISILALCLTSLSIGYILGRNSRPKN